jgi:DnaK suppressor protein
MLSKEFIETMKNRLIQEKKRLEKELGHVAEKKVGRKEGYTPRYFEFGEKEDENIQEVAIFSHTVSIENELENLLREVNEALERIKKNIYGFCKKCQREINQKRLEAFPAADLCIKCKKQTKKIKF